ncbi:MAG: TonB-dependent receptor [Alphaproteobacteria bacterium]|nr:TonB-dependent receptor [Alphaproteobacteria bacterium]
MSKTAPPEEVTGNVSINYVTVGADVRAPLKRGWWFGASARRSFQDLVTQQTDQFPLWPRFYDFTTRAELVRPHDTFAVYVTGAGDRYDRSVGELDVLDPYEATTTPRLSYGRDYQVAGFRYDWSGGRVASAILHDALDGTINVGGAQRVRTVSFPTRLDAHGRIHDSLTWEAGAELRSEVAFVDIEDAGAFGALVTTEAPATAWGTDLSTTMLRTRLAAYGELQARIGPIRLMPGLRVGVDTAGWEPLVEPRLAARARIADQTELRLGVGRYQQRPETVQLAYDPDLPTTQAWELTGGIDQTVANRLEIVVEGYGKWLDHVLWQPVDGPPVVAAKGRAFGGELTVRYRLREQFFLWAWFAAGRALLDDGEVVFPSGADQPLSGGLVVSWNILPPLNVAVRYRLSSGLPFTDVASSLYDGARDTWTPTYGPPNGDRMPLYQKIDVHLAYTVPFHRWSLDIAADVWIVPPSAAQLYPTWNYDYSERAFVVGPTVVPLFSLRASF